MLTDGAPLPFSHCAAGLAEASIGASVSVGVNPYPFGHLGGCTMCEYDGTAWIGTGSAFLSKEKERFQPTYLISLTFHPSLGPSQLHYRSSSISYRSPLYFLNNAIGKLRSPPSPPSSLSCVPILSSSLFSSFTFLLLPEQSK